MRPYQKINHFVGTNAISRKNYLARNLLRMKAYYPKEYKFFPHTWSLPADLADFRCQFTGSRRKTFIIKPDASSQGRGIFLTRNIEDIDPTEHLVAQRYLHRPFLIDGLKFDLRIYVLLAGCNPLRLFVHQDGLVRFATSPYAKPTGKNLHDKTMHLTNYAINKSSSNFKPNRDPYNPSKGHKRSLFHVLDQLKREGHDVDALCKEIDECLCKTIIAIQPSLAHIYGSCKGEDLSNSMCFEVLGIDIMIDHKLTPWLIEVNHSPSFSTDSELDTIVKFKVIRDALVLLGLSSENRRRYHAQQRVRAEQWRMAMPKQTREERLEDRRQMMNELAKRRTEWEDAHMGGWRRIFPTEERAAKYSHLFEAADEIWQSMTGMCRTKPILMQLQEARRRQKLAGCGAELPGQEEKLERVFSSVSVSGASTTTSRSHSNIQKAIPKRKHTQSTRSSANLQSASLTQAARNARGQMTESTGQTTEQSSPFQQGSSAADSSRTQAGAASARDARDGAFSRQTGSKPLSQGTVHHSTPPVESASCGNIRKCKAGSRDPALRAEAAPRSDAGDALRSPRGQEETLHSAENTGLTPGDQAQAPECGRPASPQLVRKQACEVKEGTQTKLCLARTTVARAPNLLTANRKRVKKINKRNTNSPCTTTACFPFPWHAAGVTPSSLPVASEQERQATEGLKIVRVGDLRCIADALEKNRPTLQRKKMPARKE
ncbi:hypothetical protein BESB_010510 [Besnoitia besnoiti]|uniref:Tubulin-tyrosine ligase family protein n=1 Tax=Besnoitia besnoiti TaxID=94643 RepID=A0A2A9ML67_BESBE|nr:hypothetical protein BESB_010510 [Besnoitia besnoiti]PFH38709.1 hypothetical protein BESB_010510 [Besnoitia besnoiti]